MHKSHSIGQNAASNPEAAFVWLKNFFNPEKVQPPRLHRARRCDMLKAENNRNRR